MSPPAWGRGLKQHLQTVRHGARESPPAWGRGLKLSRCAREAKNICRPLRGGVD